MKLHVLKGYVIQRPQLYINVKYELLPITFSVSEFFRRLNIYHYIYILAPVETRKPEWKRKIHRTG